MTWRQQHYKKVVEWKYFLSYYHLFFGKFFSETSTESKSLLSDLNKWYLANKLSLNIEKTCYSAFSNDSSNRNDYSSVDLKINAANVKMCDSVKYLGVWIYDKLNCKIHIDYIYSKLVKFVGIFYKISHKLPLDCLKMLYFSFVHFHILYSVEIYANTYTSYLDKLLKLNNKLLRILQQKDNYCRNIELYVNYNILPVTEFYVFFKILCIVHKFTYHKELLPKI